MLPGRVIAFSSHADLAKTSEGARLSVIQVARDRELSRLRAKVLASAGYSVMSITPEESLAECGLDGANRVWVFCHTVEFFELVVIAVNIRRMRPDDRLVLLNGLEQSCHAPALFDASLDPVTGLDGLLRTLADISTV